MGRQKIICRSKQTVYANEDSKEITSIAKKRGIQMPSTHLGFFKTIYAKIEEPNLNRIRLAKHAVEDALPGLIGSQVNFEHLGAGFLCGCILDAWINNSDEIEVVYSFFKSIYPDEYERSLELASEGELAVSFELLSERESQEWMSDGTIRLHDIDFQGMGHLMDNPPACPEAKIYEFASACKKRLSNIEERELVCASQIEQKCDEILSKEGNENPTLPDSATESDNNKDILAKQIETKNKSEQGGNIKVTEEQKAKVEQLRAEFGDLVKDISDEDLLNDAVVAEIRKEKEATVAEAKTEEAEPEKEEAKTEEEEVKSETVEAEPEKEEAQAEEEKTEEKSEEEKAFKETIQRESITEIFDDGQTRTVIEQNIVIDVIDWKAKAKELEAKVEELENSLKAKDSEIETVKANAEKVATVKIQLKDNPFAKDFTDEDFLDNEKVAKVIEDQKKAETIASRKEELKNNEYAKDFSDEDYLNDVKVELAKVKKEKDELEAKTEKSPEKIEATVKEEEDMATGTSNEKSDDYHKVMASVREEIKEKKETQKVYTKR